MFLEMLLGVPITENQLERMNTLTSHAELNIPTHSKVRIVNGNAPTFFSVKYPTSMGAKIPDKLDTQLASPIMEPGKEQTGISTPQEDIQLGK